ncbi:peptidyl serine alpha-galactosyltransferase, partial [Chrysochromulina tobinii]
MHLLFNRAALLLSLAGVASASEENPRAREGPPRVHTVFCAECSDNFDYKSLGVYWSHALSGMPGNVTRLLACDEQQLKTYKGLKLGPTFVHKNHGRLSHRRKSDEPAPFGSRPSDGSPSYNKPASIMHWALESEEAKHVDYVLYIDADMLLRRPMDPIQMGVKKGVVVSEHVGYLDVGIKAKLPFEFLPKELAENAGADLDDLTPPGANGKRHASGGWYHFFHMDDIKVIAPRWLHWYTHGNFNAVGCNGDLFGDPPKPTHLERLCSETVLTLNDAMCVYYTRSKEEGGCGKTPAEAPTCPKWKEPEQRTCEDKEANCKLWSSSGECAKNSGFMLGSCPRSCGHCDAALQASVPAWSRGLALAKGEIAPPMREMQPSVVAWEEGYPAGQASEEDVYEEISALRNKREKKRPRESGEAARVLFGGKAALGMAQEGANAEARRLASSGGGGEGGGE